MKELQIIKEFQDLIPALKKGEFDLLEENILKEGIRESIIIYGNTIVDGHNRYKIAQKHGLEFNTLNKEFDSVDEVKLWIKKNQAGRRNISDFARYEAIVGIIELELLIAGKEKQGTRTNLLATDAKDGHDTRSIIAKKLGWSSRKVGMAKFVKQNADLEALKKLSDGEITINKVDEALKKALQKPVKEPKEMLPKPIKEVKKISMIPVSSEMASVINLYMEKSGVTSKQKAVSNLISIGIYNYTKENEL